jgi:ABC-type dipeptide/oligopeptide/nickel transport system permease component
MRRYIFKRLLLVVPTILGVITLVFFLRFLSPGDPARLMLGERANVDQISALRSEWGLDQPWYEQYGVYMGKVLRLDMGTSYKTGEPVIREILARFPATFELSLFSIIIAALLGVAAGVVAATKRNTIHDYLSMVGSLVGVSMPIFWLGLILIMVFSVWLGLFPTGGRVDLRLFMEPITGLYVLDGLIYIFTKGTFVYFLSALHHIFLPAMTLALVTLAVISRMTRSSMLEVLGQDYVRTARAKGLAEKKVVWKHAFRNALLPVITVIGVEFGSNLAGAVLTETIFAWPGLGNYLYSAVLSRDYLAVQGGAAFVSVSFILINLVVDILYAAVNPKIRY